MRGVKKRQNGFTFVELIMSVVIIAIAVTGVLLVYTHTVAHSADPVVRQQALAIAEAYLEEIASRRTVDTDGDGETVRALFDDVDDYNGLVQNPPTGPDGSSLGPALDAYTVSVNIDSAATLNGRAALRVDVEVAHTSGIAVALWSYRTVYN